MIHDPLCPHKSGRFAGQGHGQPWTPTVPCQCALIARVRHNERGKALEGVWYSDVEVGTIKGAVEGAAYQRGYTAGYNDHARAQQHWQDTHGAYRAAVPSNQNDIPFGLEHP